ncbi:hypothetical protein IMSAG049_01549 [Clostridiales bacterium]|nr:hypothetical protein IMSAG049_01549 [Clostridiales bacterium]
MGFFNIIGLMALVGVPIIIILHMLKRKQKIVHIPSVFLWERASDTSVQSKPWQKLRKSLPLILQLITATALGLAAARPYISVFGTAYNYVIVLDASASMSAEDMGEPRLDHAKKRAEKLVGSSSALSKITVIAANDKPYVAYGPGTDKTAAIAAINNISQNYGGIDMDTLEGILASEAAKTEAGIYVFTDNEKDFENIDASLIFSGKDTSNCAITLASASEGSVLVNVKNYGTEEVEKTVTVFDKNMAIAVSDVTIPAGAQRSIVFEDVYDGSAEITLTLSPEDILKADDIYYLAVNNSENAKVLLVSDGNTFIENAIRLTTGTEIYKMSVENMESTELSGYDLYIFDGSIPSVIPTDGSIFLLNPPVGNEFVETSGTKQLNCYTEGSSDLTSNGTVRFIISEAKEVQRPSWAVTECSADGAPLIMRGENNGQKICIFTFDIHNSDLPLLKDFPIMIYNLTDWFLPNRAGMSVAANCGGILNIQSSASADRILVTNPDGEERTVAPPFPAADYADTNIAGFYTITTEELDGTVSESVIPVNAMTEGESELSALFGQDKEGKAGTALKGGANLMEILLIIAALSLLAEWWVKYYER